MPANSNRFPSRRRHPWLNHCLMLLVLPLLAPGTLWSQQRSDDPSHRLLELPGNTSADVGQQIQTLLGLSKLIDAGQQQQTRSLINQLTPPQLQALAEVMRLLPNQNGDQPPNPAAIADQLKSDSEFRSRAQDILEQYLQDRQFPQTRPGGQSSLPWNLNNTLPSEASPPGTRPSLNGSARDSAQAERTRIATDPADAMRERARREAYLRRAAELWGEYKERSERPSMSDFLQLVQRDPSVLPDISSLPLPERRDRRAADGTQQINQAPLPGSGNQERGGIDNQQLKEAISNLKQALPDQLQDRLDRQGIAKTFRELMQQAKTEVRQSPAGPASGDTVGEGASDGTAGGGQLFSGWESAILNAVTEGATEIGEFAKDLKEKAKSSKKSSNQMATNSASAPGNTNRSSSPPSSTQASKSPSQDGPSQPAGNFLTQLAKPPEPRTPDPANTDSRSSDASISMSVPFELVVVAVLLTAAGIYFFVAQRGVKQAEPHVQFEPIQGMKIASREDVIRAFHLLTQRSQETTPRWWTHRRAAEILSDQQPGWRPALEHLAELYEQARYRPADSQLTQEQLRAAQIAWEHCNA